MIERIDLCMGNLVTGTGSILSELQDKVKGVPVRQWSCLGNCHMCYRTPFALLNDIQIVEAETAPDLLKKLLLHLSSSCE